MGETRCNGKGEASSLSGFNSAQAVDHIGILIGVE